MVDPLRVVQQFMVRLLEVTLIQFRREIIEEYLPVTKLPITERKHHHRSESQNSQSFDVHGMAVNRRFSMEVSKKKSL